MGRFTVRLPLLELPWVVAWNMTGILGRTSFIVWSLSVFGS